MTPRARPPRLALALVPALLAVLACDGGGAGDPGAPGDGALEARTIAEAAGEVGTRGGGAAADTLVISSDPELRELVAELLPGIARRSGLELREPVRVERRTRAELERYLRAKLDEELPLEEEERLTRTYALLGMVPPELDLRQLLLDVYTEQVAGFYDADSTALFVLDDQPPETLRPLLVHELVHAVQDQAAPLDSLTHKERGNDRQVAAQAAIEGHATLVMLEHVMEELQGRAVDLAEIPDFAAQLRPALESVRGQYPALGNAPRVIQESVLFPYTEGAGFVQAFWRDRGGRPAPFGDDLPQSTEQVLHPERFLGERDAPTPMVVLPASGEVLLADGLGELETRIFLEELAGSEEAGGAAVGWDGDAFALLGEGAGSGLAWASVWDDADARERFVEVVRANLDALPGDATVEAVELEGRPAALLRVGDALPGVRVELGRPGR